MTVTRMMVTMMRRRRRHHSDENDVDIGTERALILFAPKAAVRPESNPDYVNFVSLAIMMIMMIMLIDAATATDNDVDGCY